ncbi:Haloacid dehalogenase-like hydrolase (HAD) superfamily protein isoform 2 [Hibiscus syriacus]|uniref:Haloacid dehalogenase-like hydrolase (HAD) superfamily protein isoform 2 n=1 Tax=Hibiscus syriacus TaxID=106335 RepID=A0A6A3C5S0_HIBSY|nr:CBBY-like protein [Hibiscus syriacus]KAE8722928.1 Haloacid dehalogenase-like hydrolase (HAD) superfamily protein isoform 2 [Hibiscus syriacus]
METACCSILYSLGFSKNTLTPTINTNRLLPQNSNLRSLPSFSFTFPRNFNSQGKKLQFNGFTAFTSSSSSQNQNPSQELAVLLEVDGVLMDAYQAGNRQAFNLAFQKLGLDCANWTKPVYLDLVRRSADNEEKMLVLYFNRIGWPTSLPTSEKDSFVRSVLREKKSALEGLMLKSLPLQPGAEEFIDDACNKGIPVIVLTSYSKNGDKIARSIVEKLGDERLTKIKIVGNEEVEKSLYGQLVFGKGVSASLDEQLAKEARKAALAEKQRIAKEVASMLKVSVNIDTTSSESLEKIVVALRAGAEIAEVPVCNCVLIAGSQPGLDAAEQIGMPRVVLRSSFTSRAEFPTANAIMDGFGGPDLTISKLCQKRWS